MECLLILATHQGLMDWGWYCNAIQLDCSQPFPSIESHKSFDFSTLQGVAINPIHALILEREVRSEEHVFGGA